MLEANSDDVVRRPMLSVWIVVSLVLSTGRKLSPDAWARITEVILQLYDDSMPSQSFVRFPIALLTVERHGRPKEMRMLK